GDALEQVVKSYEELLAWMEKAPAAPPLWWKPRYYGQYLEYAHRNPDTQTTWSHQPFRHSLPLLQIAVDPFLLGLIGRYHGKPFMISQAIASRYFPMAAKDFSSRMWHHDNLGKRINVMVLLTDVGPEDQYMSYLKGSHEYYHAYADHGGTSRITTDQLKNYPPYERVDCLGAAGTV